MADTRFKIGQVVVATKSKFPHITAGKHYVIMNADDHLVHLCCDDKDHVWLSEDNFRAEELDDLGQLDNTAQIDPIHELANWVYGGEDNHATIPTQLWTLQELLYEAQEPFISWLDPDDYETAFTQLWRHTFRVLFMHNQLITERQLQALIHHVDKTWTEDEALYVHTNPGSVVVWTAAELVATFIASAIPPDQLTTFSVMLTRALQIEQRENVHNAILQTELQRSENDPH